ncbi:hypothetical protein [Streptomyces sp. PAN_FS17]|uniref:hypothetical protein n=1 Tax=Streptomyces sp. PAN_FS17 TaxID=1855351 RepID=UPI00115FB410|nr:hypothetical protein [Streptomyces sp. PAN_FS17]
MSAEILISERADSRVLVCLSEACGQEVERLLRATQRFGDGGRSVMSFARPVINPEAPPGMIVIVEEGNGSAVEIHASPTVTPAILEVLAPDAANAIRDLLV